MNTSTGERGIEIMAGKMWVLYHIKKETREGEERTFFDRVGRGVVNKDGSYNIWLETLPVGMNKETTFNFQEYKPKEKKERDTFEE
jgi:hypothetical protein